VLDVNVGYPEWMMLNYCLRRFCDSKKFDIPLCLDSQILTQLKQHKVAGGKCLINSVNGEEKSLKSLLKIAKEYEAL